MGQYVGSGQITKNLINLDLIEIIQFCLKIYYLCGCMGQSVGSGQMTYLFGLELFDIIQFCLTIYDLWRHFYLQVDAWVNGWAHVKSLKSNNS